jgi:AraC family transcriptional regulator, arabinose operon regulatory protein
VGLDQAIFHYCVAGRGYCELEGRRHDVRAGDLMVVPRTVPHAYGTDPARPWSVYWFHTTGQHLELLLAELGVGVSSPVLRLGHSSKLVELLDELNEVLDDDYSHAELLYSAQLLSHAIGLMIRLRRACLGDTPGAAQRVADSIVSMKRSPEKPLSLAKLARLANLSSSHYTVTFRRLTGSSPHQYLTRLRIHRAAHLLATTHHPVKTVAALVGYSDPLHFSKAFHRLNGVSPREFRSSLHSDRSPSRTLTK